MSNELSVAQHRLIIQSDLPELWYKDEGGRDKCMVLPVHLVDATMSRVCNREVRLKCTLLYDNEQVVMKQDILKLSPDCQQMIDATGEAFIRFRIEDVSKNHQGQTFRLKIEADTQHSPMNFDVAYDCSSTISVRSKRNKRARTKLTPTNAVAAAAAAVTSKPIHYGVQGQQAAASMAHPESSRGITITEEAKRKVRDAAANMAGSVSSSGVAPPGSLNGAMSGIIQWAAAVVNGLHALEWQIIGYESKSDGTPDHSRPLYRCPSCWRYKDVLSYHTAQHGTNCVIANILMQYATETMVHLHTILKAVDASTSSSASAYGQAGTSQNSNHGRYQSMPTQAAENPMKPDTSMGTQATSGPPQLTRGITDMVNNLDMPALLRGASSGLNDIMSSIPDGPNDGSNSGLTFGIRSVNDSIEHRVYYVLAKIQATEVGGAMGFPAFDQNQQLLGYYQEGQDNATTEVIFISLNDLQGTLTQRDVAEAHQMLMTEAKSNSGAVHSLPKCNNNLVKMKEDALMYHWSNGSRGISSIGW